MRSHLTLFGGSFVIGSVLAVRTLSLGASSPGVLPAPPFDACFSTIAFYQNEGTTADCNATTASGGDNIPGPPGQQHLTPMTMNKSLHVKGKLTCQSPSSYTEEYGGDTSDPVIGNGMCGNTFPSAQCQPQFSFSGPVGNTWTVTASHARHKTDGSHGCELTGGQSQQNVTFTDTEKNCDDSNCRVDEDSDTFAVNIDEPADCNDANSDIYPGAYDTNPYCGSQDPWPVGTDYNCNGVDDADERTEVCSNTPILIDVSGNGFALTSAAGGVQFNLDVYPGAELTPWTAIGSDDAWLVLDRNGNGLIDDGRELFGNFTPQPRTAQRNGFLALAVFDENADNWIDVGDSVFQELRLWRDMNHDGVSQARELSALSQAGILRISLSYREVMRVDRWGNWFRYAARVIDRRSRDVGPVAFDVFLGAEPPKPIRRLGSGR